MEKPAKTSYPIHNLLQHRWSPRAFSARVVEPDKLGSLLEAARWAPSSFNEQPWSFLIATKDHPDAYERLLGCLTDKNRTWAQRAPVLMLSVAKLAFDEDKEINRHAFHDVGQAMANLTVQATAFGIFVHQMAGFHIEKAREVLGIPAGHDPVAMVVLGYPDDPSVLPEPLRQREVAPRQRRALEEFVFTGRWGEKWRS